MTNAQTQLQAAYNEFIADFVDRHERVPSTRDEAHDVADKIVAMAKEVAALCKKYARNDSDAYVAADYMVIPLLDAMDDATDGLWLSNCAVAVELGF